MYEDLALLHFIYEGIPIHIHRNGLNVKSKTGTMDSKNKRAKAKSKVVIAKLTKIANKTLASKTNTSLKQPVYSAS